MPHTFSAADVERLARLARLALTPDETTRFAHQLDAILRFAEHIQSVDTSGVTATAHPALAAPVAPLRDDEPRPSLSREEALANAPATDAAAHLFKVPRVL